MRGALDAIYERRAIKVFDLIDISDALREQILRAACLAPSSFNLQPYKFYWVQSAENLAIVARLCVGQKPAETASALVVVVADLKSLSATTQSQLAWMRSGNFAPGKIEDYERTAKIGRILFAPGPLQSFAAIKWALFRLLNVSKILGMPPLFRKDQFKWAAKSTSLACQNLMIAAEALGLNSCPMEGFDGRRLCRFLGLSRRQHEIVMVIAIGKKSQSYIDTPQWRRHLSQTVIVL
jgi:nitroreductase